MFKIKRSLTRIQQGIFEFLLFLNFLKHRWLEVLKIKLVIIDRVYAIFYLQSSHI